MSLLTPTIERSIDFSSAADFVRFWITSEGLKVTPYGSLRPLLSDKSQDDKVTGDVINNLMFSYGELYAALPSPRPYKISDAQLMRAFRHHIQEKKDEALKQVNESIKYIPTATNRIDQIITHICSPTIDLTTRQLHQAVLTHFIWQVKRKMSGLDVEHHIVLNLTGRQGQGKSKFLENFERPLQGLSLETDFSVFADKFSFELFRTYYIMRLEEAAHIDKADKSKFKSVVTADIVHKRDMHTEAFSRIPQRTSFIGTSNESLYELFQDVTGIRRLYEIEFIQGDYSWQKDFNFLELWQSVDERTDVSPIRPHLKQLSIVQEFHRFRDTVESWFEESDFSLVEQIGMPSKWTKGTDLFAKYQSRFHGQNVGVVSERKFYERLRNLIKSKWTEDQISHASLRTKYSNLAVFPITDNKPDASNLSNKELTT